MSPSELRGLVGKYLVPGVRGRGPDTARFAVLGFGPDTVRVQSSQGMRSSLPIPDLEQDLARGLLTVED